MPDIEDAIEKAIQAGKFDNLPGKGKPLSLDENPHADPEWRLAHHVLKTGGFSLPWIEARKEIEAAVDQARQALRWTWEWRMQRLALQPGDPQVEPEWQRAVQVFGEQVSQLNRQIRDYNLQTPNEQFQMRLLSLPAELERVIE